MKRLVAPLAFLLLLSTAVAEPSTKLADAVDAAARAEFERQGLVGLAVGVVDGGKVVFTRGYGFEDREAKRPVDPAKTCFRWASVSKPLTAIAAVQLVAAGKLDLDADVRKHVPEFPEHDGTVVTMRQLLGHLGGIVHYRNGMVVGVDKSYRMKNPFKDVVNALDRFKQSPLVAPPGTKYSYSTHGFILASAVIQRAGKAPFWHQVRDRIVKPLKLDTLRPDYQWEKIPHRAVGYRRVAGFVVPSSNTDVSWKLAGGGFLSSVDDFAAFAAALTQRRLVGEKGETMLWTAQSTADGKATRYGLGFSVSRSGERLRIGHTGSQEKTKTCLVVWPRSGRAVVVMTNSEYANPSALAKAILTAVDAATGGK